MKRNTSSTTSLTDMGVPAASSEDKLNMFESGEEGTLDYRLRFAMAEHAHRCSAVQCSAACCRCWYRWRSMLFPCLNALSRGQFIARIPHAFSAPPLRRYICTCSGKRKGTKQIGRQSYGSRKFRSSFSTREARSFFYVQLW